MSESLEGLMDQLRARVEARRGSPISEPMPALDRAASIEQVFRAVQFTLRERQKTAAENPLAQVKDGTDPLAADLALDMELPMLHAPAPAGPALNDQVFALVAPDDRVVARMGAYRLADLLDFDDAAFIRSAYVALLRREPDPVGLSGFLQELRSGRMTKVDLLWYLRHSEEGLEKGVRVRGLFWAYRLGRLRKGKILGPIIRQWQSDFVVDGLNDRLERLERDVASRAASADHAWRTAGESLTAAFAARDAEIARLVRASTTRYGLEAMAARLVDTGSALVQAHETLRELRSRVGDLHQALARLGSGKVSVEDFQAAEEAVRTELQRLNRTMAELDEAKASRGLVQIVEERAETRSRALDGELRGLVRIVEKRAEVQARDLDRQLRGMEKRSETRSRALDGELRGLEQRLAESGDHFEPLPDDFYVSFENHFRGTEEDIAQRVQVYPPLLAGAGAGSPDRPIVDLGCGRGELLQVVRGQGLHALGVELNKVLVDACGARGLHVIHGDALDFLRGAAPESLGAVTALHVIEHLPFVRLIALFDAALRALRPGGVAIFETPNPENVTVGSLSFWYDPTHRAPLPPALMEWLAKSRGFERAEIMRLHPAIDQLGLRDRKGGLRRVLDLKFQGSQDYAVIAYKGTQAAPQQHAGNEGP